PHTAMSTLSLHDALPISVFRLPQQALNLSIVHELDLRPMDVDEPVNDDGFAYWPSSVKQEAMATLAEAEQHMVGELTMLTRALQDRKSTRLNSSHVSISY